MSEPVSPFAGTGTVAAPPLRPSAMALLVAMLFASQMAITAFLPALPAIAVAFAMDTGHVAVIIPAFLGAFAVAQLVLGPLADALGRRLILLSGVGLFAAASFVCAVAPSIEVLVAARIAQGAGACTLIVLSRAIVRDTAQGASAARALAYLSMAMGVGPAIAPLLGGTLVESAGWRSIFYATGAVGLLVMLSAALLLPETLPASARRPARFGPLAHAYLDLLGYRAYMGYALAIGLTNAIFHSFVSGAPTVLISLKGVPPQQFGLYLMTIPIGFIATTLVVSRLVPRFGIDRLIWIGGGFLVAGAGGILVLALAGADAPLAIVPFMILHSIGSGFSVSTGLAGAMNAVPPALAGTAAALAGFFQMALSAIGSVAVSSMHHTSMAQTAIPMTVFACGAVIAFAVLVRPWRR
ncbi:MAG: multidrug effflux MFS transporter [Alphaproteobacteria bacterium]